MNKNDARFVEAADNVYIDADSGETTNYFESAFRLLHGNVVRWSMEKDNAAGADFYLRRYNSSGVLQDSPLKIAGADGSLTLTQTGTFSIAYDSSNHLDVTVSSAGAAKLTAVGSSDSIELETGDGKIILDAKTDIDIDPEGNDINLLGDGAGKITMAATGMTMVGGDTTGDYLTLQGNSADATEYITITGASDVTIVGTSIVLDGPLTLDDDATITDAADVLTITQDTITLVGGTSIKLDGTVTFDDDGTIADAANVMTITQDTIQLVGASGITLDGAITLDDDGTITDASDETTITQDTITLAAATKINLDGTTDITGYNLTGLVDLVTLGLKGTVAIDSFPFNNVTNVEAAAAYCKVYDASDTYYNLATSSSGGGYSNNYQLFPDTEAENDAVYFGAASPFGCIYTDVSATNATYGADSITWEYYNGSWTALTIIYDHTDSDDQDGDRPFQEDGYTLFSAPSDWTATEVDSQSAYWIRARCNATVNITQIPLLDSHEHYTITAAGGSEIPFDCTLSRARINWDTVSTGTADTKVILHNVTTGESSAQLTITKALREAEIADLGVTVSANDTLTWFVSQVDGGGTEYADGSIEIMATRT